MVWVIGQAGSMRWRGGAGRTGLEGRGVILKDGWTMGGSIESIWGRG
jgi:hypothetical protein